MDYREYLKDLLEHPEKYHYQVIWYVNVLKIGKRRYSLGYCTYGKGIAFIADNFLTPMLVDDIIIQPALNDGTPEACSDGKWCVNSTCPLSRGKGKDLKEVEKKLEELGLGFNKANCERIVFEKPVIELRRSK